MIIDVVLQLVQGHRRGDYIDRSLGCSKTRVRGEHCWRSKKTKCANGSRRRIDKIYLRRIGIGSRLNRPALYTTGRTLNRECNSLGRRARLSIGYGGDEVLNTGWYERSD